ncbi:MAG: HNH endonuclease [archaeon]|nr:HNH endonuclease [archaeon]
MSKNHNKVLSEKQKAYNKFITSPEWQAIKDNLFALRGKKCEVCGSTKYIQVHHLTYKRFGGKEKPEDLKILCGKHHKKVHGIGEKKVKITLPYYRKLAINKFNISKKGSRGWISLAKSISKARGKPSRFTKQSAKVYIKKVLM